MQGDQICKQAPLKQKSKVQAGLFSSHVLDLAPYFISNWFKRLLMSYQLEAQGICWSISGREGKNLKNILTIASVGRTERQREGWLDKGTPLQHSCLENPMDGGVWWAAVHGVAKSRTWLRDFTFTSMHWRRQWQPTPVFLPEESQGRGSLVGCCLCAGSHRVGHDWSDLASWLHHQGAHSLAGPETASADTCWHWWLLWKWLVLKSTQGIVFHVRLIWTICHQGDTYWTHSEYRER